MKKIFLKKRGSLVKIKKLKYTNAGINSNIEKYVGSIGIIEKNYTSSSFGGNDLLIRILEDNFSFWISSKDVIDISKGIFLTYEEVLDELEGTEEKTEEAKYKICSGIYHDFISGEEEEDIKKKYNVSGNLILEIYFLFRKEIS